MTNKKRAAEFLRLAGSGEVRKAYDSFTTQGFIHHNQYFKGDRHSLMTAMEEANAHSPNKAVDVRRSFEDGDFVITHSLVTRKSADEPAIVVVHIFRFEGERIAELWDVGQPLSKESPNENGPI